MKKKLFTFYFLAALAVTITSGILLPQKALAALSGRWINIGTLEVEGKLYHEDNIDNDWHFYLADDPDGCKDEIDRLNFDPDDQNEDNALPRNDTEVRLRRKTQSPSGCNVSSEETVNLSVIDAAAFSFNWIDEAAIEIPGEGTQYVKDDSLGGAFVKVGDNQCKDTLIPSGDKSSVMLVVRTTRKTGDPSDERRTFDLRGPYQGHTWVGRIQYEKEEGGGCIISYGIPNLSIGLVSENSGKTAGTGVGTNPSGGASEEPSCESEGGEMSWLLCPVLRVVSSAISQLDQEINNLLIVPESYYNNDRLHQTWGQLRNLALLILVPIMLLMVLGTALGFEFVSAYTVKKALPRFFIAVLFITLSWSITQFFIGFINTIGQGIAGVLGSAFGTSIDDITLASLFDSGGGQDIGALLIGFFAAGAALSLLSIGIVLSYALVALLGLFVGFILLSLRQFLVVALMLFAPLAILAWIFPGNDKLWKLWRESFTKLLLLYPLVIVLIAAGRIFAKIVQETATGGGDSGLSGLAATFIKLIAYIGPYFFIPAAFKFAGGLFANFAGMANDRSRGLFDRQKKYRGEKMGQNYRDFKAGDKAMRPRAFNNLGRRVGAGWSGRFGVGERGSQAIALNTQANADEALKSKPRLAKLAFNDDGNAVMGLSGGTSAGAEAAARDLFTDEHGNYDEVRAGRALAAASAVGFNRSNAQAAMTTLAQNKARSVAVGARGRQQVQRGIDRLAGGNAQHAGDLRDSFAYNASGGGRGDLGATNWNEAHASLAGFERTGLYESAKGHQSGVIGAREDATALAASADVADRQRAAMHLEELRGMLPNTSGPVRDEVNRSIAMLEADPNLQAHLRAATGATERERFDRERGDTTHARYDPAYVAGWTPAEIAQGSRDRAQTYGDVARHNARSYERPDPNHL